MGVPIGWTRLVAAGSVALDGRVGLTSPRPKIDRTRNATKGGASRRRLEACLAHVLDVPQSCPLHISYHVSAVCDFRKRLDLNMMA